MTTLLKVKKMPFEKHSYILSSEPKVANHHVLSEWAEMATWMNEQGINYNLRGNILHFYNDKDEGFFLLRFYNGQA